MAITATQNELRTTPSPATGFPGDFSCAVYEKKRWDNIHEYLIFLRSKKTYIAVADFCGDKHVLDFGCGSGYGAAVLAERARAVVGVDIDERNLNYCRYKYARPNLTFQHVRPGRPLPFGDGRFDVVVSFQVIEHIADVRQYLSELDRVLKRPGVLLIATPNKKHRLLPFQKPWNPEHVREYSYRSLRKALSRVFDDVAIKGIYGTDEVNRLEYERTRQDPLAVYFVKPVSALLKKTLPTAVQNLSRRVKTKLLIRRNPSRQPGSPAESYEAREAGEPQVPFNFTLDDIIAGDDVENALDLLAVCSKK